MTMQTPIAAREVRIEPEGLAGIIGLPKDAQGLVIFAHGSGSGRFGPRNQYAAQALQEAGLATLLLDLLKPEEEQDRANVFDIALLASRLVSAARWARRSQDLGALRIGFFGASTGGGAALVAAAEADFGIAAVVSRGGRPDLTGDALEHVRAPTLLIVGGADGQVIDLNRGAYVHLRCEKKLMIVPGAGHLFEEPGTLDEVVRLARDWFLDHLGSGKTMRSEPDHFLDRRDAGRQLAAELMRFKTVSPVVFALPRGGVPVAFEIAQALNAPLDVLFVRKIGAPGYPELGLGAVVDGSNPQVVLNEDVVTLVAPRAGYIAEEKQRQLEEIERRREVYLQGRKPIAPKGKNIILVDDGIATGGSVKAALQALRHAGAAKIILAVPVAPRDTLAELSGLADETVCLMTPEPFQAVGMHYRDFTQTTDEEVTGLLERAPKRG